MIGSDKDLFEQWLAAPLAAGSGDPRFVIERASGVDYERIYGFVGQVFGVRRPRAEFDWLYRDNPRGPARCWIATDVTNGQLAYCGASWPWATLRAGTRVHGFVGGDVAVAPGLQRTGVLEVVRRVMETHPWHRDAVEFGWPNEKSLRYSHRWGVEGLLGGPLPRAALYLHARSRLRRRGWPAAFAGVTGLALDAWSRAVRSAPRSVSETVRVEEVRRFDSSFEASLDAGPAAGAADDLIRFPRDADFLNWRYNAHPTYEYRALALVSREIPSAWCVLKLAGRRATLMEFTADVDATDRARILLSAAVDAAAAAGCDRLEAFATPGWPHWPLLHRAGFVPRPSERYLYLRDGPQASACIESWQILPGDNDQL